MAGFLNLSPRSSRESDKQVIKKLKNTKSSNGMVVRGSGGGLLERISLINAAVEKEFLDKNL